MKKLGGMKVLITLCLLTGLFSCNVYYNDFVIKGNKELTVKTFDSLKPYTIIENCTSADIIISVGVQQTKIEAESNLVDLFEFNLSGNKLTINAKKAYISHYPIKVFLTNPQFQDVFNQRSGDLFSSNSQFLNLRKIYNEGSGDIKISGINTTLLVLVNNGSGDVAISGVVGETNIGNHGSGDISYSGKIDSANIVNSGSGDIQLSGENIQLKIKNSGSGNINAGNMPSQIANIRNSGSGDISVFIDKTVDLYMSGSGNVQIKGKPVFKSYQVSGSGDLMN